jgi:hypothetical protein
MQREIESANPSISAKLTNQTYLQYMEWQRSRLQYYIGQVRAGVQLIQSLSTQSQPVQPQHPPIVHQADMITPPPLERQAMDASTLEKCSVDDTSSDEDSNDEDSSDEDSSDGKRRYATKEIILEAVNLFINKYERQIRAVIISNDLRQEMRLVKQVCAKACKRISVKTRRESLVSITHIVPTLPKTKITLVKTLTLFSIRCFVNLSSDPGGPSDDPAKDDRADVVDQKTD